jgi:hypothetical protein
MKPAALPLMKLSIGCHKAKAALTLSRRGQSARSVWDSSHRLDYLVQRG